MVSRASGLVSAPVQTEAQIAGGSVLVCTLLRDTAALGPAPSPHAGVRRLGPFHRRPESSSGVNTMSGYVYLSLSWSLNLN